MAGRPYHATCPNIPIIPRDVLDLAVAYARAGDTTQATAAFSQALQLALPTKDSKLNSAICREGGAGGAGQLVLPACDHALALTPRDSAPYVSRAVARAFLGDYKAAAADLREAQRHTEDNDLKEKIDGWIAELGQQHNPFDRATLGALPK